MLACSNFFPLDGNFKCRTSTDITQFHTHDYCFPLPGCVSFQNADQFRQLFPKVLTSTLIYLLQSCFYLFNKIIYSLLYHKRQHYSEGLN